MLKSWQNSELALSNLDALRSACNKYINLCSSRRRAATIDGFVTYLNESETEQAKGTGAQTVNVLTYHGSKGLEWPWVVLTGLDAKPKENVFGVNIEAAQKFDPANPLADRKIQYWPCGSQRAALPLSRIRSKRIPSTSSSRRARRSCSRLMGVFVGCCSRPYSALYGVALAMPSGFILIMTAIWKSRKDRRLPVLSYAWFRFAFALNSRQIEFSSPYHVLAEASKNGRHLRAGGTSRGYEIIVASLHDGLIACVTRGHAA